MATLTISSASMGKEAYIQKWNEARVFEVQLPVHDQNKISLLPVHLTRMASAIKAQPLNQALSSAGPGWSPNNPTLGYQLV